MLDLLTFRSSCEVAVSRVKRTALFSAETWARGGGPEKVKAPVAVATARTDRTDIVLSKFCTNFFFFPFLRSIIY